MGVSTRGVFYTLDITRGDFTRGDFTCGVSTRGIHSWGFFYSWEFLLKGIFYSLGDFEWWGLFLFLVGLCLFYIVNAFCCYKKPLFFTVY